MRIIWYTSCATTTFLPSLFEARIFSRSHCSWDRSVVRTQPGLSRPPAPMEETIRTFDFKEARMSSTLGWSESMASITKSKGFPCRMNTNQQASLKLWVIVSKGNHTIAYRSHSVLQQRVHGCGVGRYELSQRNHLNVGVDISQPRGHHVSFGAAMCG